MSEICNLCDSNRLANTFCSSCSILFCTECIDLHISLYDCQHKVVNYTLYQEENTQKFLERKNTMKDVCWYLKERLLEANCEVDQQLDELIELINLKKQELFTIIDEIAAENVLNNNQNLKSAKITLESMSTDHSILELSKNLILEDVSKMVYSEKTAPSISKDLETSLKNEFNYYIEVYPSARPYPLYSFKPGSELVYEFDVLSEEETIKPIKNFESKTYAGWCLAGSSIIYTGGWKNGYSSYEVFEINIKEWTINLKPSLTIPRYQHAAVFLLGTVYVISGMTNNGLTKNCEKWILGSNHWTSICKTNVAKTQMGVCVLNDQIYVSGETEIERYDPTTDEFIVLPIRFEGNFLSVLVSKDESIIIFRGTEVTQLELSPSPMAFKFAEIENIVLWSSTIPVILSEKIYFVVDNQITVYSFDLQEKRLTCINDLD